MEVELLVVKIFVLLLAFSLTALIWSFPLVLNLETHIPLGRFEYGTVPLFNLWTLIWNAESIKVGYHGYWNAPIFYPLSGTFALSEPQQLTGILFATIFAITDSVVVSYNLIFLMQLVLNGFAGYMLGRSLGSSGLVSFISGIFVISLPYVVSEFGVLQLTAVWIPTFSIASLFSLVRSGNLSHAYYLALCLAAGSLSCLYYFIYTFILIVFGFLYFAIVETKFRALLLPILIRMTPICLLVAPILFSHYRAIDEDISRSLVSQIGTVAHFANFIQVDSRALGYGVVPWLISGVQDLHTRILYPGSLLVFFGVISLFLKSEGFKRQVKVFCIFGILFGLLVCMLPAISVAGVSPFQFLREIFAPFSLMRNFFRYGVIIQLLFVVMFIFVAQRLEHLYRASILIIIVCLGLVETFVVPQRLFSPLAGLEEEQFLKEFKRLPYSPAIVLPAKYAQSELANDYIVAAMIDSLSHGKPLVNGYSGFLPERYKTTRSYFDYSLENLRMEQFNERNIRYLLLNKSLIQNDGVSIPPEAAMILEGKFYKVFDMAPQPVDIDQSNKSIFNFPGSSRK